MTQIPAEEGGGDRGHGTSDALSLWDSEKPFVVPALAGFGFEYRSCAVFRLKAVLRTGAAWPFVAGDRGQNSSDALSKAT